MAIAEYCIIVVGVGQWYPKGIERLKLSLVSMGYRGDFISFIDRYPPGCPTHQEVSYAFKAYALAHVRELGYKRAMWLDCSMWAISPVDHLFDIIQSEGYLFQFANHWVGNWCTESVLRQYGITREEAMKIPMFPSGCFGISFESEIGNLFTDKFLSAAKDGSFIGPWRNSNHEVSQHPLCCGHRHDMTMGSLIAWKLGMQLKPHLSYMAYAEWFDLLPDKSKHLPVCFICRGM